MKEEEAEDKSPQSSDEDEDNYNSEEDAAEEQQRVRQLVLWMENLLFFQWEGPAFQWILIQTLS